MWIWIIIISSVVLFLIILLFIVFKNNCKGSRKRSFTLEEAREIASEIGIDLKRSGFSLKSFQKGLNVELEHGCKDPETDVTHEDYRKTGKIAWAHLKESKDYYELLEDMEKKFIT